MIVVQVDDAGKGTYRPATERSPPIPQKSSPRHEVSSTATLSNDLIRTSLELQYFDIFWSLYLPKSVTVTSDRVTPVRREAKWAEYTSYTVPQSEVLRCALLALSTSKVGRDRQDKYLLRRGIELYGKALSLLAKELKTPGNVKPFGVLNSCRLLALYEQLNDVGASAQNWKGHIHGLLNLVRLHPPEAFSHPGTHELFLEARYNGVISGLSNRKASFLSFPDWTTGPWNNRTKDVIDTSMDIMVKIPGIFEEWDLISTQPQTLETLKRAQCFKQRCEGIENELQTWYRNLISHFEHAHPQAAEALVNGMDDLSKQVYIPEVLERTGLHYLYAMTIYWTACTILHATMDLMYCEFPAVMNAESDTLPTSSASILKYCICIAISAKFFLKPHLGLSTTLSISHAGTCLVRMLSTHHSYYPEVDMKDVEQLRHLMGIVQNSGGFDAWKVWKFGMDELNVNKQRR
ncbi:hypothetical protein N0V90_000075 [Kalmusia sp. IMI 367209]|nr:hypothetical protein N0V90_000075 [Kalmusia sp. IMI 367209]